jgi:hypothetical protein
MTTRSRAPLLDQSSSVVNRVQHLPQALFSIGLYLVLTILPLALLVFWLVRVRFASTYKRPDAVFDHKYRLTGKSSIWVLGRELSGFRLIGSQATDADCSGSKP